MFSINFNEIISSISEWVSDHGLKVISIAIIAVVISFIARHFIVKLIQRVIKSKGDHKDKMAEKKREDTLIKIFNQSIKILIITIALMMILSEFGVEIGPLLAAAGVAGLALGFGGQYLIRDLISGSFIILENQYRVGDVVCFGGTCGLVEDISMRMTTLRDLDGTVHHVPHGEITKVSNLTKNYSRVNLNIRISYDSNLEKVIEVVNMVGEEMFQDEKWRVDMLSAPKFLRVDEFSDSAIVIKILGDTLPIRQWDVAGELRKRLKVAFDKEGIVIPFPQRDIHVYNSDLRS